MEFNEKVLWLQHIPNSFSLLSQHYSNPRSLLVKMCELSQPSAFLTFSSGSFQLLLEEIAASQLSSESLSPSVHPASNYKT